jgi:hypothetical protein
VVDFGPTPLIQVDPTKAAFVGCPIITSVDPSVDNKGSERSLADIDGPLGE